MRKLISFLLTLGLASAEEVTVKLDGVGTIRGSRVDQALGEYYYAFKGIRYAAAPTGKLRFRPPVEPEPLKEEYDATDDGHICPQYDISTSSPIGDEDCLNLNIYTPKLDSKKRAVMVYLHGGSFIMGGGASYFFGPNHIIVEDVLLVTLNYRLGAFGFLATDDKASAGNMGLQDQILALKWVKRHIAKFGGDPNKVTLFGEDSGAASATLLAVSPSAHGLFQGVMALSGNALCDHYMQRSPQESALELAVRLECSGETGSDIMDCLRRQTQQDIVRRSNDMFMFFSFPRWFAPNVDGHLIPEEPEELLQVGRFAKVPFVVGQTKDEGAFFYRLTMNSFNNGVYDDNFLDHKLPRILPVLSSFHSKLYPITRQVRKKYFVNVDMESEDEFRPRFVELLTDLMFTRCTDKFARILANHSVPTYRYSFDYRGQYSIVNLQGEQVDMGVAHGDDLQYIFHNVWGEEHEMSPSDNKFTKSIYAPLLASFAKTSVPTPQVTDSINIAWAPTAPNKERVFRIDSKLSIDNEWKQDAIKFWFEDIPALFKKKPKKAEKKSRDEL